ncbi:MAG: radical SAM protein, partial [Candidatus Rokuibacteriota bacterium]
GPAVPRRPASARRFLDEHTQVDALVMSEGEMTFRDLLVAHVRQEGLDGVGGIAWRHRGEVRLTAAPVRVQDFSETVSPYLDGTFDALVAEDRARFSMALLETNRGCPFSCTFCDWSLTRQVVEFPLDRVLRELDWISAHQFGHVCITDANFGIRPRDHDIARRMAELKDRTGHPSFCYFYLTKNNHRRNLGTIEILHEAGIGCCVGLAVQDFDDDVLAAVKRDNIQSGESIRLRDICAERGIATRNELIFGLPKQTFGSFTRTVAQAMPPHPRHSFVVFQCRLLDNTELASPASIEEFGIETRRVRWRSANPGWDAVIEEYQDLVVGTKDMPIDEWRHTYRFVALAGAAYNVRLLRVVLHWLGEALGVDLVDYLAFLCERTRERGDTSFAAVGRLVDGYLDSILACGPFTLSHELMGEAPLEVADAIAVTVLAAPDAFLREAEEHTRRFLAERGLDTSAIAELFRFQGLLTPRFGHGAPVTIEVERDWAAYATEGARGAPEARPRRLTYVPPAYVRLPEFERFAATHLACVSADAGTGHMTAEAPLPRHAAAPAHADGAS